MYVCRHYRVDNICMYVGITEWITYVCMYVGITEWITYVCM